MKATDLMIGDWVTFRDDPNTPIKIWGINEDGTAFAFIDKCEALDEISINDAIIGVPLTPEILVKNGFGYVEHDEIADVRISHYYLGEPYFCRNMNLHIGTDNRGHFWINTRSNTIYGLRNVHELQHALKLCGIEKAITL